MGYVIIPKPNLSGRESINSRCRHFDLLLFCCFGSICHNYDRCCRRSSIDRDQRYSPFLTGRSLVHSTDTCVGCGSAIVFGYFSVRKNLLGQTEMRTHERKGRQYMNSL